MTTTKFTLRILYDEFTRFMNFWTVSNEDLDRCRDVGCKLIFFGHPTVDYIVRMKTQPPFLDANLTAAQIQPGIMMLSKKHILIPSLKTRLDSKRQQYKPCQTTPQSCPQTYMSTTQAYTPAYF